MISSSGKAIVMDPAGGFAAVAILMGLGEGLFAAWLTTNALAVGRSHSIDKNNGFRRKSFTSGSARAIAPCR